MAENGNLAAVIEPTKSAFDVSFSKMPPVQSMGQQCEAATAFVAGAKSHKITSGQWQLPEDVSAPTLKKGTAHQEQ